MPTEIIDRGRGPEIEGTRVTIYRIMDYVVAGDDPEQIATELNLTGEQVQAALAYIAAHREDVEDEYARILERVRQPNPEWVEAGRSSSPEELKRRILAHREKDAAHADRRGQ